MEPRDISHARERAFDAVMRSFPFGNLRDAIETADVLAKWVIDGDLPEKKED